MARIACSVCGFAEDITASSYSPAVTWQELIAEKGWQQVGIVYFCPQHGAARSANKAYPIGLSDKRRKEYEKIGLIELLNHFANDHESPTIKHDSSGWHFSVQTFTGFEPKTITGHGKTIVEATAHLIELKRELHTVALVRARQELESLEQLEKEQK